MRGPLLCVLLVLVAACTPEPEISNIKLRFDPSLEAGFYSLPMPNDARTVSGRRAGGAHPDFRDFPNPAGSAQLEEYLTFLSAKVEGFGLNSGTWFSFTGPVDFPEWDVDSAALSQRCEGPIRIVDVDPDSPERGRCLPAQIHWIGPDNLDPYLDPNTLIVAPWWGFPLRGATTYAILLVSNLDESGALIEAPPELLRLLAGQSDEIELSEAYSPLADFLAEQPDWLGTESLASVSAATVFTTQHPTKELASLAEAVRSHPELPQWNAAEGLTLLTDDDEPFTTNYSIYTSSYQALNFQSGEIPYSSDGGGFVFEEGEPVPQWEERIPFAISEANAGFEQPEAGWPILLHAHGTGGDRYSHLSGGQRPPAKLAAARGFLSIGIPQPIHGERWPGGTTSQSRSTPSTTSTPSRASRCSARAPWTPSRSCAS